MTRIASSSASTDAPGARRGPPIAAIASQNAPAPRPSSTRPALSTSRDAAALASIAGGRSGRLATSGARVMFVVWPATKLSSVHASRNRRWYGWSWTPRTSSPAASAARAWSSVRWAFVASGTRKTPSRT
jgi:hypothetical protein